jgi:hypothetical protein
MLETNPLLSHTVSSLSFQNSSLLGYQASRQAVRQFRQMRLNGWLRRAWDSLTGRSSQLLDLEMIEKEIRVDARHYAGIHTVRLDQIRGSEGRTTDFDAHFAPLQNHNQERWISVFEARQYGLGLAPVELIQVGDRYFVRDGHHRISVAHTLGEQAIEAEVTVWEVKGRLPWETNVSPTLATQAA